MDFYNDVFLVAGVVIAILIGTFGTAKLMDKIVGRPKKPLIIWPIYLSILVIVLVAVLGGML